VVINTVENYTGRNIDEVKMDLQTLFAAAGNVSAQPLLTLKEPFMYQYSAEPAGTILQQSPEPGTHISGPMVLEFVVSRGQENVITRVPALTGLSVPAALEAIQRAGIGFAFSIRPIRSNEREETVVAQDPAANASVAVNTAVSVVVGAPLRVDTGEVFGLFSRTMPENPYPLPVSLEALLPSGERQLLAAVNHPGGAFTFPYRLPLGSVLILSMLNREIYREEVRPAMNDLSLNQL
jgi:beta-lactam-binding protein with PASTA domain